MREAVAASAAELLRPLPPDKSIPKVLQRIGEAVRADRVQTYENVRQPDGRLASTLRYAWSAPGIPRARQSQPAAGALPWDRDRLLSFLAADQAKALLRSEAPEPLRGALARAGVVSLLLVPLFVDGEWRGQIGFSDCKRPRRWSRAHIDTLKTVAEMIGAALARAHHLAALSEANRVVENSPVVVYRLSARPPYPLLYISRNIKRFGYSAAELMADPLRYVELLHPDERASVISDINRIASGKSAELDRDWRLLRPDKRPVWVNAHARALYDPRHRVTEIEGVLLDIDERKAAQGALTHYALTDPVTNLPNRAAFVAEVSRAIALARQGGPGFAVHYIDLDHFKDINDVLGHGKGDELLKAVADRLIAQRRSGADLVARFGGDEFAVLQVPVAAPADASTFARRVLRSIAEPFNLGEDIHVTASAGISIYDPDLTDAEDMLKQVDVALYRAKDSGRNRWQIHSEGLDAATVERVTIGSDLRRAIERGELTFDYQPQVELATGRIVGFEALARWNHATRGPLPPSHFVPIAEKTGSIVALGHWAIDAVGRQIAAWRQAGVRPPPIAINVSAMQLKAAEFSDDLIARLDRWRIEPSAIELELTESVLMETTRQHGEVIEELRARGFSLAIDDFGTGYSSLAYLRAYHVNHIKIAQAFVEDIRADSGDLAIVRAAISLGRELGIAVVAEGVETESQLALLREAGCRYVQGFLFSPPVGPDEAVALMRAGTLPPRAPLLLPGASV